MIFISERIALEASPETVVEPMFTVSELTGGGSILYLNVGGQK